MMHKASFALAAALAASFAVSAAGGTGEGGVAALRARARAIASKMTLEEKCSQLMNRSAAVPRLGIRDYDWWNEALHGVARNGRATVFPEPIGLAASFDEGLVRKIASAIGDEARAKYEAAQAAGRHGYCTGLTFWSPNVNIFRDPRWGRGMETWGEDPYLTSRLGVQFVKGLQGDDPVYLKAAACAKHYAVHSGPESLRHSFDVSPSRRDLYETYLPAFRALVQEGGVESVMGAYNRVYGESASASEFLLKDVLRGEFGFRGHVVSDCGAVTDIHGGHALEATAEGASARALRNGLDIECGSSFQALAKAVRDGLVPERQLDEAVVNLLTTRLRLGILEPDAACPYKADPAKLCSKEHVALARRAAAESMVLLKNDGVLPLDEAKVKSFGIMGAAAVDGFALMGNYYGFSPKLVTYLEGMSAAVGPGTGIHFAPGYYYGMIPGGDQGVWAEDDVVIAFVGNTGIFEGEEGDAMASSGKCGDRATLALQAGQLQFLRSLRRACDARSPKARIVTVVTGGSPFETDELMKLSDALVVAWYGGEEGGSALADLLLGRTDFTGRLPVTFPVSADVLPPFEDYSMEGRTYRYQTSGVAFPFGYGLSYASAEYESVKVSDDFSEAVVTLRNAGTRDAVETVQVYVSTPNAGRGSPNVSLRGFARIAVPAGKSASAAVALDREAFTEIGADGSLRPVAGRCIVHAASAAPCERSRELGARSCSAVVEAVPRLLFFRTDTCRRCVRLERELFSTQRWADFAEGRIALERIDMDGGAEGAAAARYGVSAKGSLVLVSAGGGRAASRIDACEDSSAVIPWLRAALASPPQESPTGALLDCRGLVTEKTAGWRFEASGAKDGASFNPLEGWYPDKGGKLVSPRIAIPKTGAYYRLSFEAFAKERSFEAVAFYDGEGNMVADNYDVLYGGEVGVQSWSWRKDDSVCEVGEKEAGEKKEQIPLSNSNSKLQLDSPTKNSNSRHYERIVFAHEGVKEVEVFFQSAKGCTVSDVRFEPATVEEAAKWCDSVCARLPPVKVEPTGNAFLSAPKTLDALKTGKPWRILMLGDSIVQDTFHSQFHALVKRAYPKSDITWLVSVRGSTGCWYYRFPENFEKYVTAYRPDCVIVGGISNWRAASSDFPVTGNDAIFEVGEKIRASGIELIVVSPTLSVDTRMKEYSRELTPLAPRRYDAAAEDEALSLTIDKYANSPSGLSREGLAGLKDGCARRGWGYIDAFTPAYRWLYESGLPWSWYSRDYVHSGELGKQVIARIMLAHFTAGRR